MTATSVNGLAVLADEATQSPLIDGAGRPVFWPRIRTLLLENDTTVYGCVHCDFTAETTHRVRAHLSSVHRSGDAGRKRRTGSGGRGYRELSLEELLARLAELEKAQAERDRWRTRALKAERELALVRRVLKER